MFHAIGGDAETVKEERTDCPLEASYGTMLITTMYLVTITPALFS